MNTLHPALEQQLSAVNGPAKALIDEAKAHMEAGWDKALVANARLSKPRSDLELAAYFWQLVISTALMQASEKSIDGPRTEDPNARALSDLVLLMNWATINGWRARISLDMPHKDPA